MPSSSLISTFAFMCCQGGNQQSEYQVLILKSTKGIEAHNSFLLMIISKSPDILFAKTRILRGSMLAEVLNLLTLLGSQPNHLPCFTFPRFLLAVFPFQYITVLKVLCQSITLEAKLLASSPLLELMLSRM